MDEEFTNIEYVIIKTIKKHKNGGIVYLPKRLIGKKVKIIVLDED